MRDSGAGAWQLRVCVPHSSHPPDLAGWIHADACVGVVADVDREQIGKARDSLSMPGVRPFQNGRLQHADSHLLERPR